MFDTIKLILLLLICASPALTVFLLLMIMEDRESLARSSLISLGGSCICFALPVIYLLWSNNQPPPRSAAWTIMVTFNWPAGVALIARATSYNKLIQGIMPSYRTLYRFSWSVAVLAVACYMAAEAAGSYLANTCSRTEAPTGLQLTMSWVAMTSASTALCLMGSTRTMAALQGLAISAAAIGWCIAPAAQPWGFACTSYPFTTTPEFWSMVWLSHNGASTATIVSILVAWLGILMQARGKPRRPA